MRLQVNVFAVLSFLSTTEKPPNTMHVLQPAAEAPKTILVLNDADQIRDVVKMILSNAGYIGLEAKDGAACMQVL